MRGEPKPALLDGLDALHVLGRTVERDVWVERFRPGRSRCAALRSWERFKAAMRACGLADTDPDGVLVFRRGARAALEAMLPPAVEDDAPRALARAS